MPWSEPRASCFSSSSSRPFFARAPDHSAFATRLRPPGNHSQVWVPLYLPVEWITYSPSNFHLPSMSQIGLGGNPSEFITLVLFDSFADIDSFWAAFTRASADAKLIAAPAGTIVNTEWRVYRYVRELSIIPPR